MRNAAFRRGSRRWVGSREASPGAFTILVPGILLMSGATLWRWIQRVSSADDRLR